MSFTRRAFLAGPAVVAAPWPQTLTNLSNSLAIAWPADKLAASILPADRFRPFPTAADRAGWDALPEDARTKLLQQAEQETRSRWDVLPATVFLDFRRNGNRSRYEAIRTRRRNRLQAFVIGECIEGKGRFLDEITNGIWLTCEESFWGVPAHLGAQKAGTGLPDVSDPIVDLFAAETASLLAWTDYLLAPQLKEVSPLIAPRIRTETETRILKPALERDFSWMGFNGRSVNNWDPWICSNWLTAALLLETDQKRKIAGIAKILKCLDNFLNSYHQDGGCDEGPGYWGRAGASLFDCLELFHLASNGPLNAFPMPLVRQIGLYICRAHIHDEWYTNFADAAARVHPAGDLIYRYGARVNDDSMKQHGAFSAFYPNEDAIPGDSIGRQLPALFHLAELRKAPRKQALIKDVWLPGIQVMTARMQEDSSKGLYIAAQGGHNAESHNHNDVGNFIVFSDGRPAIIDVGVETYTAKTFSAKRYEIWTMQSAYHNCPTVDGVMQAPGRHFEATDVSAKSGELRLNIAKAYPKEANIEIWHRTLKLDRSKNQIEITEDYRLVKAAREITLTLMTPCVVTEEKKGTLRFENSVKVDFDPSVFTHKVEEIDIEDTRLQGAWGKRLYRVLLIAANPPQKATWTTRIS